MDRKRVAWFLAVLVPAIAALAIAPAAEAETRTLVSGSTTSLCVNPTGPFEPYLPPPGKKVNYAPLSTSSSNGSPFPDRGSACASNYPLTAAQLGSPGQPTSSWAGAIPGASWVSIDKTGLDLENPPAKYYIYDAAFPLCPAQVNNTAIHGGMLADNEVGAFLNGTFLNDQPNHNVTGNFNGGATPFPATGSASGPFVAGINVVQFVVLDQTTPLTGVDFSATVTSTATCDAAEIEVEEHLVEIEERELFREEERVEKAVLEREQREEVQHKKEKEEVVEFPGLGRCAQVATGTGKYKTAGCNQVPSSGNYEWYPGPTKNHFTSTEGKSTLETGNLVITCKSDKDAGEYIGESLDMETITFSNCNIPGATCQNTAVTGEVKTGLLKSLYGFINEKTPIVGVSLEAVKGNFAEFMCGGTAIVVRGSVIAPVTPINKMTTTFALNFTKLTKDVQAVEKFEFAPKDILEISLNGGPFAPAAFTSKDTVTNEEPLDLRATP